MTALEAIAGWPVPTAAAAVVGTSGVLAEFGDQRHRFALASVTKPLAARAAHVAVEEGVVDLDSAAGPPGSTVRHLLAHASGLAMHSAELMAEPGKRRIYSNYGFRVLAETVQDESGIEFGRYVHDAVFEPLSMTDTRLDGGARAAGYGATSTVADLVGFAGDLLRPVTVAAETHAEATTVQFPGLDGVLPGVRRAAAERLGTGVRAQGRQVAALDRLDELAGHLRSLRAIRHVLLGRSGAPAWHLSCSPTAISASGPGHSGPRFQTRCWPNSRQTSATGASQGTIDTHDTRSSVLPGRWGRRPSWSRRS